MGERIQVVGVLLIPWLVEAQLVYWAVDPRLVLSRVLAAAEGEARGCARQREEGDRHEKQQQDADEDPPDDVERHAATLCRLTLSTHTEHDGTTHQPADPWRHGSRPRASLLPSARIERRPTARRCAPP